MRLSTMTNLFYEKDREDNRGFLNSIRRTHAAGFNVMDFCMCPMQRHETELLGDDWEMYVDEVANEAAKLGVEIPQSHLPYPSAARRRKTAFDEGAEKNEFFIFATKRAIDVSAKLGVKWAVVHPVEQLAKEFDTEENIKYNHEIYDKYLEQAAKAGVGLSFENMADVDGKRRFCSIAEDLNALIDSFGSEYVGACWDFGHGNRVYIDQTQGLAKVGHRLRTTHLDDNIGKDDLHTIPYFGRINWEKTMQTLKDINYTGDLNFELSVCKRMPPELVEPTVELIYRVGQYLLTL